MDVYSTLSRSKWQILLLFFSIPFLITACQQSGGGSGSNVSACASNPFLQKFNCSIEKVERAAQAGDPDAQYALGYMYYYGVNTVQDRRTASMWIGKAARQGQPLAQQAMGMLRQGGDVASAGGSGSSESIHQAPADVTALNSATPNKPLKDVLPGYGKKSGKESPVIEAVTNKGKPANAVDKKPDANANNKKDTAEQPVQTAPQESKKSTGDNSVMKQAMAKQSLAARAPRKAPPHRPDRPKSRSQAAVHSQSSSSSHHKAVPSSSAATMKAAMNDQSESASIESFMPNAAKSVAASHEQSSVSAPATPSMQATSVAANNTNDVPAVSSSKAMTGQQASSMPKSVASDQSVTAMSAMQSKAEADQAQTSAAAMQSKNAAVQAPATDQQSKAATQQPAASSANSTAPNAATNQDATAATVQPQAPNAASANPQQQSSAKDQLAAAVKSNVASIAAANDTAAQSKSAAKDQAAWSAPAADAADTTKKLSARVKIKSISQHSQKPTQVTADHNQTNEQHNVMTASRGALTAAEQALLKVSPQHYTVQLMGSHSLAAIQSFIFRNDLAGRVQYYSAQYNGGRWYMLILGNYVNAMQANQAVNQLASSLRDYHPWVKSYRIVQREIRTRKIS